ncbi:hypothetical protein [Xanthomonas axonopodis]|uniref:hypothetical protein n=1 Tax=Xanthomonas axonopodis TaxID=53413 RepID=UPI000996ADAF|nr:hypothetical protein [Xanthomonas axonopodis]
MNFFALVGLALAMTFMSGCKQKMEWKEQVWLDEGRFVEVERQAVGKLDFPNSSTIATLHQEFRYDPLGVIWTTEGATPVRSFYIEGSDAYLITSLGKNRKKFCVGRPKGDYIFKVLRWRGGRMQEIDQHEAPIQKMRFNLSGNGHWAFRNSKKQSRYISWKDVAESTGQFDYKPPQLISEVYGGRNDLICH